MTTRNVFGTHTDVAGMNREMIAVSALTKVLFHPNDAALVRSRKDWAHPNAYWLYRSPLDQDATTPLGELQTRYKAARTREQMQNVAKWYAAWLASWMLDADLAYMFVEGGPNEEDPSAPEDVQRAVWYSEEFVRQAVYLGLKPAPGMYSFGKPGTLKWDGVDGWAPWQPVFDAIDEANAGHADPRAGFQLHEYALRRDMLGSIDCAIDRYSLIDRYQGPVFLGEFGWSSDGKPSSTEETINQLLAINTRLGQDDRLAGYALWDCRSIAKDADKFDYMQGDLTRALRTQNLPTLPITVRTGSIIPIPLPIEEPPMPTLPKNAAPIITTSPTGQNMRSEPSLIADVTGDVDFGEVAYISKADLAKLGQEDIWIYAITKDGQKGFMGAWLLAVA